MKGSFPVASDDLVHNLCSFLLIGWSFTGIFIIADPIVQKIGPIFRLINAIGPFPVLACDFFLSVGHFELIDSFLVGIFDLSKGVNGEGLLDVGQLFQK